MGTNSDTWYAGPIPVSKGFWVDDQGVETQVYPVEPEGEFHLGGVWGLYGNQQNSGPFWWDEGGTFRFGYEPHTYELVNGIPTGPVEGRTGVLEGRLVGDYTSGTGSVSWGNTFLKDASNYPVRVGACEYIPGTEGGTTGIAGSLDLAWGEDNDMTSKGNKYSNPRVKILFPGVFPYWTYVFWGIGCADYRFVAGNPKSSYLTLLFYTEEPIAGAPTTRAQARMLMEDHVREGFLTLDEAKLTRSWNDG